MRPAPDRPPGSEPLRWMDPLASDAIAASYAEMPGDAAEIAAVMRCHTMLWRCVLMGRDEPGVFQRELSRLAAMAGLVDSLIEQVNRDVMAELFETIAIRYSRSPRIASSLSFEVARAACRIAIGAATPARDPLDLALAKRLA